MLNVVTINGSKAIHCELCPCFEHGNNAIEGVVLN